MENWFCMIGYPRGPSHSKDWTGPAKYYKNGQGQWFGIFLNKGIYSDARGTLAANGNRYATNEVSMETLLRSLKIKKYNCNDCKYRLACLVQIDCLRTFEGR